MFESALVIAIIVVVALLYAIGVGFVTRAILGTPVGWPRTIIVGLLVFGASWPFAVDTLGPAGLLPSVGDSGVDPVIFMLFLALAFGWVSAFGIALLVVTELFWPTRPLRNPITSFRELVHRRRRTQRYLQILTILSRHGIGWLAHGRRRVTAHAVQGADAAAAPASAPHSGGTPAALVGAINEAGVTFVKLGQILSTRRDLLPDSYIEALSTLQSSATTLPWSAIRAVIEEELTAPIETVFGEIDETPLAAASVAQVHTGVLVDGTPVVLKVQRPGAAAQVAADVDIIVRLAQRIEERTAIGREFGAVDLATGFARSLTEELDYGIEFVNTRQIGAAVEAGDGDLLVVPRVYAEASSKRLLTMDRVEGTPLSSAATRLASMPPEEREALASALLDAVLEQVIVQGVFHADLHPGNLMLRDDGRLGMIDFGAIGVLERSMREVLVTLLLAAANEDDIATTDALLLAVQVPDDLDVTALQRDLGRVLTLMKHGDASIFSAMLDVVREHHLAVPASLGMAFRSIITLQGCLAILDPDFDMVERALGRMPHMLRRLLSPSSLMGSLQAQGAVLRALARRLPRRIEALTSGLENGTLSVRMRSFAAPDDRWWIGTIVTESIGALIAIAAVTLGIVLVISDSGPFIAPNVHLYSFVGASVGLVGFLLILRSLRRLFLRQPR